MQHLQIFVFRIWYIIIITSEVLLLGLQDQNEIFPGAKLRYSWCLNEKKKENQTGNYFHDNKEQQKLVIISISQQ